MKGIRISEEVWERAKELRKAGKTYVEIANELGIGQSTVAYHLNPESARKRKEWGKSHPHVNPTKRYGYIPKKYDRRIKMHNSDWKEAEKMRNNGATYQSIADYFGIANSVIYYHFNPESKRLHTEWQKKYNRNRYSRKILTQIVMRCYYHRKQLYLEGKTVKEREV